MTDMLSAALAYAELGYLVFPLVPGEKTPFTAHGLKDASGDESQIEAWWTSHPTANIGLVTAGLLIVDVDGGDNPWLDADRARALAVAPLSRTPRGGRHYIFRQPDGSNYRNTAGKIAPKVDTRADGGYIVAAPSVLADGKKYQWVTELEPRERLPLPPAWLLNALAARQTASKLEVGWEAGFIPDGKRHSTLVSLAGNMRRVGMSEAEIFAAIMRTNLDRCKPPMDQGEVAKIAKGVARYEPDQIATAAAECHWDGVAISRPILLCMENVEPRDVDWLWFGRMAAGRLTLLVGMPGLGKSYLTCDMAARISTGTAWPDGSECQRGSVLLVTGEDDPGDTIRPRLDVHGADVSRIHLLSAVNRLDKKTGAISEVMFTLADVDAMEAALKLLPDCRLVIIDPIGSFLGGDIDSNQDNRVRSILAPIAKLAEKHGCAVLIVAHRRKGGGSFADDLAMGSRAFTAACRSVWHLCQDRSIETRRLFLPGKNNLAIRQHGLAFSIVGEPIGRLEWEADLVDMTADDAVKEEHGIAEKRPTGPAPNKRMQAAQWLRDALANGPRLAKEMMEEGIDGEGFSRGTIENAKSEIGVHSYRPDIPGPWYWELPTGLKDDLCKQVEQPNILPAL